jgi:hypothetical protein
MTPAPPPVAIDKLLKAPLLNACSSSGEADALPLSA